MDEETKKIIKEDIRIRELLEGIEHNVIKVVQEVNKIIVDVNELKKLTPFIKEK